MDFQKDWNNYKENSMNSQSSQSRAGKLIFKFQPGAYGDF